jgi:hypothetical protein
MLTHTCIQAPKHAHTQTEALVEANIERTQLSMRESELRAYQELLQAHLTEVRSQLGEAEAAVHR